MSLDSVSMNRARTVADAVLWEGYLLYPYRADSGKNRVRWQFGVLGPPVVSAGPSIAEDPAMRCECLLAGAPDAKVEVHVRFLHLVRREVEVGTHGVWTRVDSTRADGRDLQSFDEAAACELTFGPYAVSELMAGVSTAVAVPGAVETEEVGDSARLVRTRRRLAARLDLRASAPKDGVQRLSCSLENTASDPVSDRDAATAVSFLGAHLLLQATDARFVSLLEPPVDQETAAKECRQSRCFPVLAGEPGSTNVVLVSPIILYDYPEVALESAGTLFDSTEIDEILTLRVMTLTDEEKAAARATDPAAAAIIDRCESMDPATLAQLHGVLRDPHGAQKVVDDFPWNDADIPTFGTPDAPWWDPGVDASVSPSTDIVVIDGFDVSAGSMVRIRPNRRADAHDIFYAGQEARVVSVFADVDDGTHVAVVLSDDPAADLHEWYGRYLYFAPDELEPLGVSSTTGPALPRRERHNPKESGP